MPEVHVRRLFDKLRLHVRRKSISVDWSSDYTHNEKSNVTRAMSVEVNCFSPVQVHADLYNSKAGPINFHPQHNQRRVRFLLDISTEVYRRAITSEGYTVTCLANQHASRADVLRHAKEGDMVLMTFDVAYAQMATGANTCRVLILPEMLLVGLFDWNRAAKMASVRQLMRCHEQVDKIRMFPKRNFLAGRVGNDWQVEAISEA